MTQDIGSAKAHKSRKVRTVRKTKSKNPNLLNETQVEFALEKLHVPSKTQARASELRMVHLNTGMLLMGIVCTVSKDPRKVVIYGPRAAITMSMGVGISPICPYGADDTAMLRPVEIDISTILGQPYLPHPELASHYWASFQFDRYEDPEDATQADAYARRVEEEAKRGRASGGEKAVVEGSRAQDPNGMVIFAETVD